MALRKTFFRPIGSDRYHAARHSATGGVDVAVSLGSSSQQYIAEQNQLKETRLFVYNGFDKFNDAATTHHQIPNRVVGAVQGVMGSAAAAGALTTGCATVIGCGLGATVAGTSLDYSHAGFQQLVSGDVTPTYGEQVLQSLGLSSQLAALTYGGMNLGATVGGVALVNQTIKEVNALNSASKLSHTTEKFGAKGVQVTPEIMQTPQAQVLVDSYVAAGLSQSDVLRYPIGVGIEKPLNSIMNPWYRQQWKDVGMGMSMFVPKTPLPSWIGEIGSGAIQEVTSAAAQKVEKKQ